MPATNAPEATSAEVPSSESSDMPVRLGAALVAGMLLGMWRPRERRSAAVGVAGALLAGYAMREAASDALIGAGLNRQRVELHLALDVARPVHEVFTFFRDFENFPHLLRELHRVEDSQDGRSHWEIRGRDGELIEWDAVVTKFLPNCVIGWESVPGAPVRSSGIVRFSPLPDGGTHLDIALDYSPLHGSLAAAARAFVAPRPGKRIRAELSRSAAYLESAAAAPRTQDIEGD
jgi:uncharacterized membrane protein